MQHIYDLSEAEIRDFKNTYFIDNFFQKSFNKKCIFDQNSDFDIREIVNVLPVVRTCGANKYQPIR